MSLTNKLKIGKHLFKNNFRINNNINIQDPSIHLENVPIKIGTTLNQRNK